MGLVCANCKTNGKLWDDRQVMGWQVMGGCTVNSTVWGTIGDIKGIRKNGVKISGLRLKMKFFGQSGHKYEKSWSFGHGVS